MKHDPMSNTGKDIYSEVSEAFKVNDANYTGNRAKNFTVYYDFIFPSGNPGRGGLEISVKPNANLDNVYKMYQNSVKKIKQDKYFKNMKIDKASEKKFVDWITSQKK